MCKCDHTIFAGPWPRACQIPTIWILEHETEFQQKTKTKKQHWKNNKFWILEHETEIRHKNKNEKTTTEKKQQKQTIEQQILQRAASSKNFCSCCCKLLLFLSVIVVSCLNTRVRGRLPWEPPGRAIVSCFHTAGTFFRWIFGTYFCSQNIAHISKKGTKNDPEIDP